MSNDTEILSLNYREITIENYQFSFSKKGYLSQGTNTRKVNCGRVHVETSSLWADFVNKNRCISVCLVSEEKALNFDNFDNSHNSFDL